MVATPPEEAPAAMASPLRPAEVLAAHSASAQQPSAQATCWGPFDLQQNPAPAHRRVCLREVLQVALQVALLVPQKAQQAEAAEVPAVVQTPMLDPQAPTLQQ